MEIFENDSHLTNEAISALIENKDLSELQRLEIAEHLAYCDECLLRYTERLSENSLLTPSISCQASLRRRIREISARVFVNRWATAAAAVAIVVTLWSTGTFGDMVTASQHLAQGTNSALVSTMQNWPEKLGQSLNRQFDRLDNVFDFFGGNENSSSSTPRD